MVRKSGVIVSLIFIILILLFNLIFINMIVKGALVKAGEAIFGAKTEIEKVKVDLFKGKVLLEKLSVGDKNNEFKNLFEIEKINLGFEILPLLSKKIIIDNVDVLNLLLNSDRKTSGFLPPKKIKKQEEKKEKKPGLIDKLSAKLEDKAKQEIKKMPVLKMADKKEIANVDLKKYISIDNLESSKKIKEAKKNLETRKEEIKTNLQNLNIEKRAAEIKAKAENLKNFKINSAQDIPEAQKKLQELDAIKKEAESLNNDLNNAKNQITDFSNYANNQIKEVNAAKEKDIDSIMKNMNLNMLNASELEKALIGPVWYNRVNSVINLFNMAKKYIPKGEKKDKKKVVEHKREKGREVVFIAPKMLPNFWIKKINISVSKKDGFFVKGNIEDVCTEQVVIEKPLVFSLIASTGDKIYSMSGKINHIESINDIIELKADGLSGAMVGLNNVDLGNVNMKNCTVGFNLLGANVDDTITINGTIGLKQISWMKKEEDITYQVLSGIDKININLMLSMGNNTENIAISSDILEKIKSSIQKVYGKKIAEIRNKVNKEIEIKIKEQMKGLTDSIAGSNSELGKIFNSKKDKINSVNDYIASVKGGIEKQIKDEQNKVLDSKKQDLMKMFK